MSVLTVFSTDWIPVRDSRGSSFFSPPFEGGNPHPTQAHAMARQILSLRKEGKLLTGLGRALLIATASVFGRDIIFTLAQRGEKKRASSVIEGQSVERPKRKVIVGKHFV